MVPFDRTVTTAVGHGKKAARNIDAWLQGRVARGRRQSTRSRHSTMLRLWYHARREGGHRPASTSIAGASTFDEVVEGLDPAAARYEAQRCLSCGNCFECDGCYSACPEQAVIKLGAGRRYEYDFDKCTGCAICYEQCPCGAIAMVDGDALSRPGR